MATDSTLNPGSMTGTGSTPVADSLGNTPQAQAQVQGQGQGQGQGLAQGRPGGAPARVYVNEKIVPYLLDGMKTVAREQPSNPLRVLGEMLIQKSNEVEGTDNSKKSPE